MKNLLILRTNFFSKRWFDIIKKLPVDYKVIIVADNKKNDFFYPGIETVYFNEKNVTAAGLNVVDDMQWRYGDYVLYLAESIYSDYDYIWLVEPDVYINYDNIIKFFELYERDESDYICSYFGSADENWMWSKYLSEINENEGFRTFFPLIRIGREPVLFLYDERKKCPSLANDEVFVATKLKNHGFSISTFDSQSSVKYDKNHFSYRMPHYYLYIKNKKGLSIFHPVFDDFKSYFKHLVVKKSWKTLVKRTIGIRNDD